MTMLYMIVNTHNPESCAFRSESHGTALAGPLDRFLDETSISRGVKVEGSWINRPGHEFFILAESPDPHVIDEALLEAGLVGRTHTRILSVLPSQDVEVDTDG